MLQVKVELLNWLKNALFAYVMIIIIKVKIAVKTSVIAFFLMFVNSTGPWVNVTTRPSRPAGLSPPKVKVLGPESLQVRPPLYLKSFKVTVNFEITLGATETDIIFKKM